MTDTLFLIISRKERKKIREYHSKTVHLQRNVTQISKKHARTYPDRSFHPAPQVRQKFKTTTLYTTPVHDLTRNGSFAGQLRGARTARPLEIGKTGRRGGRSTRRQKDEGGWGEAMDGVHARERNREMVWTKEGGGGWVDGWTRVERERESGG